MRVTLVSNYINHHQIPFCEALMRQADTEVTFIQTMPMEEERTAMGWGVDVKTLPYVKLFYEQESECRKLIAESEVVIFGWTDRFDIEKERLESGKLTFRLSERIYREGQWKMISPRGLIRKYKEHFRYRKAPVYLLCAGAYVASDFHLIRSYPDKMLRFGYFPPFLEYHEAAVTKMKAAPDGTVRMLFASRMLSLKRPDYAIRVLKSCLDAGFKTHLDMVGDGPLLEEMKALASELQVTDAVTFHGMLPPKEVRNLMERAHIFLFPSNGLEGWGAVVNEAMNAACLVVASNEAGAVPYLLREGRNGLIFHDGSFTDFAEQVKYGMVHEDERDAIGRAAYRTIAKHWNAEKAAENFLRFCNDYFAGKGAQFAAGGEPMSKAHVLNPE